MERLKIEGLEKEFNIGFKRQLSFLNRVSDFILRKNIKKRLNVLKDVSFSLKEGEILGIIGKNGSGKSTLLRILAGIYPIYSGKIKVNGKLFPLIGLGTGMQGRLTMKENIYLVGSIFGMGQNDIRKKFDSIVEFSGLKDFVDTKLFKFSRGMLERLAFSIAIHTNPDILLLDEVFAVGDEEFRKKSADKIKILAKRGISVIFVSHELWMIEKFCDRVIWLEDGKVKMDGDAKEVLRRYENGNK